MRRVGAVLLLKPILSLALTMHHIASRRVVRAAARAAGPRKAAREPCVVEDVEGLCGAYDTILLDQFGVVHDGKVPYDGAPELVRRLQRAGKRVVVLSNSSKRRRDTIERLEAMGCGAGTLRDRADTPDGRPAISAVTSGDLVHDALAARARGAPAPLLDGVAGPAGRGLRAFVFGNGDDDEAYLVSCGVAPARVEEADCLLARGLFATLPGGPLAWDADDACDDVLAAAAARGLPLVVANPDLVRPDGRASPMPGRLMARYVTRFGGAAHPVGKPYPYIYEERARRAARPPAACWPSATRWRTTSPARTARASTRRSSAGASTRRTWASRPAPPPCRSTRRGSPPSWRRSSPATGRRSSSRPFACKSSVVERGAGRARPAVALFSPRHRGCPFQLKLCAVRFLADTNFESRRPRVGRVARRYAYGNNCHNMLNKHKNISDY